MVETPVRVGERASEPASQPASQRAKERAGRPVRFHPMLRPTTPRTFCWSICMFPFPPSPGPWVGTLLRGSMAGLFAKQFAVHSRCCWSTWYSRRSRQLQRSRWSSNTRSCCRWTRRCTTRSRSASRAPTRSRRSWYVPVYRKGSLSLVVGGLRAIGCRRPRSWFRSITATIAALVSPKAPVAL